MKTFILIASLIFLVSCGKDKKENKLLCGIPMEELDGRDTMLVVGDSISGGYMPHLKENHQSLQVIHNTCSAANTTWGVQNIQSWVDHAPSWKVCTINHGIWDIDYGGYRNDVETYLNNLEFEINVLKSKCEKVLFVNTTNISGKTLQNTYNQRAEELMNSLNVPVCNVNTVSMTITDKLVDYVHYNSEGSKVLADKISECVENL